MSHSINPFIPAKPAEITLDTLPQLFAHNRARFGGWSMTAGTTEPPAPSELERPDGVTEDEWEALGDPGKQAVTRERNARVEAERNLAAARARPKPPAKPGATDPPKPGEPAATEPGAGGDQQPDLEKIIERAVAAAVQPFADRETEREAEKLAGTIRSSVVEAAKDRFYDTGDALTGVDLTKLTDGNGRPDATKITEALDKLLETKPHLGKPSDSRRRGTPGSGSGGAPSQGNIDDRVKATLQRMQASVPGVKFANTDN